MTDAVVETRVVRRPGGIELPYVVLGPADGDKRIVFGHSLLASGVGGAAVFKSLVDAGWSVLTMDQRGHGGASPVTSIDDFTLPAMGADLLAMMDDAGWDTAWMGGGSLGAATSLAAARIAPSRVLGLALLAPPFGRTPNPAHAVFAPIGRAFADAGSDAGASAWADRLAGASPLHDATLRSADPRVMAALLQALPTWSMPDEIDAVAQLDVPVLVLAWDGDDIHPMSVAQELVALAPKGSMHAIRPDDPAGPLAMFDTLTRALEEHLPG